MIMSYDNLIQTVMSTLSVPLSPELMEGIDWLIGEGIAPNKAEVVRIALKKFIEDQAVEVVLKAKMEPDLEGDLDELAKQLCKKESKGS
jgi:Arc/MetJ-type ribon-helix-helix transcriptional regulator